MHKYLNHTLRSVVWFKQVTESGSLTIKAPFQRNPVWGDRQNSSLIDTILLEYPIPEIYMQDLTGEDGTQQHILVDGQQRIRAVMGYLFGEFQLDDDSPHWAGMSFEDLTGPDKKKIFEYSFVVRILPEMPEEQLRAIFQRLNRNTMTLNDQELRHATYWGPFIKLMEELSDYETWDEFRIFSANDRRRMLDAEYIAELAVGYLNGVQNKKKSLEAYFEKYDKAFEDEGRVRSVFHKVLGEIQQVIPGLSKTRWKKKSDFYSLFLAFAENEGNLPLALEKRHLATQTLAELATNVDVCLKDPAELANHSGEVREYVKGVERAASDFANRDRRSASLRQLLQPVWM